MSKLPNVFILLAAIICAGSEAAVPKEIEVPAGVSIVATRSVDLTTQIVKVKVEYEVKNSGKSDINHLVHAITEDEAADLAWISAYEKKKESAKLRVSKLPTSGDGGFHFFKVEFLSLLAPGASTSLTVEYSLTEHLTPYPEEITQAESQFVLYTGLANVPSVYPVDKDTTKFKVGTTKPLSFTETGKFSGDSVAYSFEAEKPLAKKSVSIHYENNSPFLVATSVERIIEVSHWGNIAVEEHIEVVHKGAKLKGSFSRLDYQMERRSAGKQPAVKSFKTILPVTSQDIYYRDEIGNISTSAVYNRVDRLEVELRPRFPLFGGWRTNYVLGYNTPTDEFLSSSGSDYALKMRLLDHLFDNAVVEKLRVKIILPETSKNIKLVTPYTVKRLPDEKLKTYLDITGRPVIVLEKENLVNNHIQTFTLYYEFSRVNILREPLIAVTAFFLLFVAATLILRMDFSISGKAIASGETRPKKD